MSDNTEPFYHLFIEKIVVCKIHSFSKAVLVWLASHYAFHLEYSKYCRDVATFLAEFILDIPSDGKKSATYLSVCSDIM